jgi:lantibiotic biosynthesis protein
LGWTVEHLSRLLRQLSAPEDNHQDSALEPEEPEEEDLNAEIDALVLRNLQRTTIYDLISGLVGFGAYFLERWPKASAVQGIRAVFDRLEKLAEHTDQGITWHTGTEFLPEWQVTQCPNGYYNLGVAHGVPGVVHLLGQISATTAVEPERLRRLLEGAVNWIIAQQRPRGALSRFPSWIVPGEEPSDSRLAWCYGDLGILAVLLPLARRAGRKDWQEFTQDLLDHCLAWPPDDGNVSDAPLCHGAAGVAHIFNRIYQSNGDLRCRDSAVLWFDRALAMRKPGTGVGGFSALTRPDPEKGIVWDANPAFLDGSIGIALALLSAVSSVEPQWDRMLLLSGQSGSADSAQQL